MLLFGLTAALVLVSACTTTDGTATPAASGLTAPATSASAPPATAAPRSCRPDPSVFPVDTSATNIPSDPADIPPDSGLVSSAAALATAYGNVQPDSFSGVVILHEPERAAVAFTGDLERHRSALAEIMPLADRVVLVVTGCTTDVEIRALQQEVTAFASSHDVLQSAGGDAIGGFVQVELRGDGEPVAHELAARYGERVSITIGGKPYPLGSVPPDGWRKATTRVASCDPGGPMAPVEETIPGLELVPTLEADHVRAGSNVNGTLRITNIGTEPIDYEGGAPEVAVIVERGTRTVVGRYTGGIGGTGIGGVLAPGEQRTIRILAGTADCRPEHGYVLSPGEYGLVVPMTVGYVRKPDGSIDHARVQRSTEIPITVTRP